jgi:hypothetical protein
MPKFLEKKLKKEYGADSSIPYKVMNSIGAMRGSKETPKGEAMESKHKHDMGLGGKNKKKVHKPLPSKKKKSFAQALNG